MTSTSSTSAKLLFQDSKKRLADRIAVNLNNAGSVARQVFRGSKSSEVSKVLFYCVLYYLGCSSSYWHYKMFQSPYIIQKFIIKVRCISPY